MIPDYRELVEHGYDYVAVFALRDADSRYTRVLLSAFRKRFHIVVRAKRALWGSKRGQFDSARIVTVRGAMRRLICLIMLLTLSFATVTAQEPVTRRETAPDPTQYKLSVVVAENIEHPVYVTNAGDGSNRMFVVDQTGLILIIGADGVLPDPFLDITSLVTQAIRTGYSEMGLLGLVFHPNYAENGQFFVHYNRNGDGMTMLVRYHVSAGDPNRADPDSAEIILTQAQPFGNHDGGQITFGPDGYLYMGLGDGGSAGDPQGNGQNPATLLGTILRIDVDGDAPYSIPPDNPGLNDHPELAPEVWAWGLRNPYRFSFDSVTGDLYIADVGQNQWEEVNFQSADSSGGENYGWRVWEGTHRYSNEADPGNTVMPVLEYSHEVGCSVTGGYVYRGQSMPDLQGIYIYGDYCRGLVFAAYRDMEGNWQNIDFMQTGHLISGFGVDEAGELYLVSYNSGKVFKFGPT